MNAPRSVPQLVVEAFELYRRYPLLFFVLAAGVIVPYALIVLAATGAGPFSRSMVGTGADLVLSVVDFALVGPLISALHVHAVADARQGRDPQLASVALRGLRVLPVVAAATIISWLGIFLGLLALIVPGIILLFRWVVVAQAAAIEHEGWLPALHRSRELTRGNYQHVFVLFIALALIAVPGVAIGTGFGHDNTTIASFLVGVLVQVFTASFTALVTALFYFDLVARFGQREQVERAAA
jgi:hypothetical protein